MLIEGRTPEMWLLWVLTPTWMRFSPMELSKAPMFLSGAPPHQTEFRWPFFWGGEGLSSLSGLCLDHPRNVWCFRASGPTLPTFSVSLGILSQCSERNRQAIELEKMICNGTSRNIVWCSLWSATIMFSWINYTFVLSQGKLLGEWRSDLQTPIFILIHALFNSFLFIFFLNKCEIWQG